MSSILDALKKLEEEEAQAADNEELDLDPQAAAKDLVGQGLVGERLSFRLSPGVALMGIAFFAVVLVGASTAITVMILRPNAPAKVASAAIPTAPAQAAIHPATEASAQEPLPRLQGRGLPISTEATVAKAVPALATPREPQGTPIAEPASTDSRDTTPGAEDTANKDVVKAASVVPTVAQSILTVPAKVEPAPTPPPGPRLRDESQSRSTEADSLHQEEAEVSIRQTDPPVASSAPPSQPLAPLDGAGDPKRHTPSAAPLVVAKNSEPEARPSPRQEAAESSSAASRSSSSRTRETPSRVARDTARNASPIEAPRKRQWPTSIRNLPALSHTLRDRHGLGSLRVQMVSPASDTRPYASAVINRMKIYLGERILNTRAKLVAVESSGVAIEITDTGERYFVRF